MSINTTSPHTFAYARVSSESQNPARQIEMFSERGILTDDIFLDKVSGKNTQRPQLQALLATVRVGDTVIVESFSRFARNTRDLLELVEELKSKDVEFVSLKENVDTNTPTGKLMLTVFAGIYEFERESILQRQAEGIAIARSKGAYVGRKPKHLKNFDKIVQRYKTGELKNTEAAKILGISQRTFFRRLKEAA
jgi:DNA invertase Pin-like site-specific DNA recombinase